MCIYGVDVSKSELDVYRLGGGVQVKNEPSAIRAWLKSIEKDAVVALESTGGYGLALAELAHRSGRRVYLLAPRQVAAHRRALGRRVKTDSMDARLIAEFVAANHQDLHPFEPWAEPWRSMRDKVRLRTRLARDRARICLRMRAFGCDEREIARTTRSIKETMLKLDSEIQAMLKKVPESVAVSSPKGVGPLTTAASIAALKQIPFKNEDAFVAYIGLDLVVSESGTSRGKRKVSSWGDVTLRNLYYAAGKCAAHREEWAPYVDRLKNRAMKPIHIHCAVARRLARLTYTLYHSGQLFDPNKLNSRTT